MSPLPLPEPYNGAHNLYSAAQMREYAAQALEEAATLCDEEVQEQLKRGQGARDGRYDWMAEGAEECAAAIRALAKGQQ